MTGCIMEVGCFRMPYLRLVNLSLLIYYTVLQIAKIKEQSENWSLNTFTNRKIVSSREGNYDIEQIFYIFFKCFVDKKKSGQKILLDIWSVFLKNTLFFTLFPDQSYVQFLVFKVFFHLFPFNFFLFLIFRITVSLKCEISVNLVLRFYKQYLFQNV